MMVRLADGVRIRAVGKDGIIERPGRESLTLPEEGARLHTLAVLLQTPRLETWLRHALDQAHPESPNEDLVCRLMNEEILLPWSLGPTLADLHQRTTPRWSAWPAAHPGLETERVLRESAGEGLVELPSPVLGDIRLLDVLENRRTARRFSERAMTQVVLATILALGAGSGAGELTAPPYPLVWGGPAAGRTYPSGGALYPIEVLVYPLRVDGVETRFYYYQPLPHRMVSYATAQPSEAMISLLNDHPIEGASVLLFLFMDFARLSLGKYGEKSYRLALLEAGHIAQNVLLLAAGLGLGGLPICGFRDEELSSTAGLAFPYEAILYCLAIGSPLDNDA